MPDVVRTAVLVSGGGSNLGAIFQAQKAGRLSPAQVVLVISSRAHVKALERAKEFGVASHVVDPRNYPTEKSSQQALLRDLKEANVRLICLAGYLRRLAPELIEAFRGRILNIHPALLPAFGGAGMYGHHVHEAVLKFGVKESGCSVHLVDEEFDHGDVIAQTRIPVLSQDTPETLAARVLEREHELYPKTIAAFANRLIGAHHD